MYDNRLGRRLAPLAVWIAKASPRVSYGPEQLARFHEAMPSFSHNGVDFDTKKLEAQLGEKSPKALRDHKRANPDDVLTQYDNVRAKTMRGLSHTVERKVEAPTGPLSDDEVMSHASAWTLFHDGDAEDGIKPHGPSGDAFKMPRGNTPATLLGSAVRRNQVLRDAKHNPVLSNDGMSTLLRGVDNLKLQGKLDVAGENHGKVLRAWHEMRTKKNPSALTSVGSMPEAVLPLLHDAAGTLGPEGTGMQAMFKDAQKVFTDLPLPTKVRGEANQRHRIAERHGFPAIGKLIIGKPTVNRDRPKPFEVNLDHGVEHREIKQKPTIQFRTPKNQEPVAEAKIRSFSDYKADFEAGKIKMDDVPETLRRFLNKSFALSNLFLSLSTLRKA